MYEHAMCPLESSPELFLGLRGGFRVARCRDRSDGEQGLFALEMAWGARLVWAAARPGPASASRSRGCERVASGARAAVGPLRAAAVGGASGRSCGRRMRPERGAVSGPAARLSASRSARGSRAPPPAG